MSLVAQIKDGKIQYSSSASSISKSVDTSEASSTVDKDQFLQLLVAEMKYQDPLEPTSNTEWVSQYATFSELEQMQNMADSAELSRANGLVGQTVIVRVTGESGDVKDIQGRVDYVIYENGEAFLSIDESLYSMNDLYMTVDEKYLDAYDLGTEFAKKLVKLPEIEDVTKEHTDAILEVYEMYQGMDEYQKTFVAKDYVEELEEYYAKIEQYVDKKEELSDVEKLQNELASIRAELEKVNGSISGGTGSAGSSGTGTTTGSGESTSTEGMTGTDGSASTEGTTGTDDSTSTEGTAGTDGSTSTEGTAGTDGSTSTEGVTGTEDNTGSEGTTETDSNTETTTTANTTETATQTTESAEAQVSDEVLDKLLEDLE